MKKYSLEKVSVHYSTDQNSKYWKDSNYLVDYHERIVEKSEEEEGEEEEEKKM